VVGNKNRGKIKKKVLNSTLSCPTLAKKGDLVRGAFDGVHKGKLKNYLGGQGAN